MCIVRVKVSMRLVELPKHGIRLTTMWGTNPHPDKSVGSLPSMREYNGKSSKNKINADKGYQKSDGLKINEVLI